jgi:predicted double-glycine peptidase
VTAHASARVRIAHRVLALAGIGLVLTAFLRADRVRRAVSLAEWELRGGASIPSPIVVHQKTWADCGPAALATLLLALRVTPFSGDQLDSLSVLYPVGTTVGELEDLARPRGIVFDSFAPVGADWIDTRPPYIVLLANHHFVVVEGVSNGVARIGDPASGGIVIALNQFSAIRPRVVMRPRL